jgi:hypothetical protein
VNAWKSTYIYFYAGVFEGKGVILGIAGFLVAVKTIGNFIEIHVKPMPMDINS